MGKILKLALILFASTAQLTSCNDNDGYNETIVIGYGTVEAIEGDITNGYDIRLDNNYILYVIESWIDPAAAIRDGERVRVGFTILHDRPLTADKLHYNIRLNFMERILSKKPSMQSYLESDPQLAEERQDSLGHQPVRVLSAWLGGKYLNVVFGIVRRDPAVAHMISLVADDVNIGADGEVTVTMRHNAYTDAPIYGDRTDGFRMVRGRVSFDIADLVPAGQNSVKIKLVWYDYANDWLAEPIRKEDSGTFVLNTDSSDSAMDSDNVLPLDSGQVI